MHSLCLGHTEPRVRRGPAPPPQGGRSGDCQYLAVAVVVGVVTIAVVVVVAAVVVGVVTIVAVAVVAAAFIVVVSVVVALVVPAVDAGVVVIVPAGDGSGGCCGPASSGVTAVGADDAAVDGVAVDVADQGGGSQPQTGFASTPATDASPPYGAVDAGDKVDANAKPICDAIVGHGGPVGRCPFRLTATLRTTASATPAIEARGA